MPIHIVFLWFTKVCKTLTKWDFTNVTTSILGIHIHLPPSTAIIVAADRTKISTRITRVCSLPSIVLLLCWQNKFFFYQVDLATKKVSLVTDSPVGHGPKGPYT